VIAAIVIIVCVLLVIALAAAAASVRVLREYERGVMFRLGRLMELRGPGLVLLLPSIDRIVRVSLRTVTLKVPPQEIITRDNVPARVTAVAYYRVIDPNNAVTEVEDFEAATLQIAQTTLRSVLGEAELDQLLSEREHLNDSLQQVIDMQTEPWGIKVTTVEIRDVEIPERMQHAIARQAEAERERRAKVINAEGEFQAASRLRDAAEVMGDNSVTLQLRYLQTLREIGGSQNSTIVFPMPIDIVRPMIDALSSGQAPDEATERLVDQAREQAEQIEAAARGELKTGTESGAPRELDAGQPSADTTGSGNGAAEGASIAEGKSTAEGASIAEGKSATEGKSIAEGASLPEGKSATDSKRATESTSAVEGESAAEGTSPTRGADGD
jgi:regulator of protease activity HflC (stomatin/prohibitin superfamily)